MEDNNDFNVYPGDVFGTGNIIGNDDSIINNNSDDVQGPIIVGNDDDDEVQGPVILGNEENEKNNEEKDSEEFVNDISEDEENDEQSIDEDEIQTKTESSEDFSQMSGIDPDEVDEEIKELNRQKEEIEQQIRDLMDQKDEIDIKIREKEEALNYKKEVEMATDKLKMYIKDLEVKPGAVRDALANLMNNMDN